jgi:hypothetical protein
VRKQRSRKNPEILIVRGYLEKAEAEIARIGIMPRVAYRYPFDIVGLGTVSKAFALAYACVELLEAHLPDEAHGLSRSIVECAYNLRWITLDPDAQDSRARAYINFTKAAKSLWYYHALDFLAGKPEEVDLRAYAREMGISADPLAAFKHWSGIGRFIWETCTANHPLDGSRTLRDKIRINAADYFGSSIYVHCSVPAIDSYCPEEGQPFRVSRHSLSVATTDQTVLRIILMHIHEAVRYALFGMGMESSMLEDLYGQALQSLGPYPSRKSRA